MTRRALRIREYIGTIVAVCTLGGLLLAFELAFLFRGLERREGEVQQGSLTLSAVQDLHGEVDAWLLATRAALGDPARVKNVEQGLFDLLVGLEKLGDAPETRGAKTDFDKLRACLRLVPEGIELTLKARPGSELFEQARAEVSKQLDLLESLVSAPFQSVEQGLSSIQEAERAELERSRTELWRTIGISALAYAALVLLVWRWVTSRMIRPLQALTQEARRTLGGETSFQLRSTGPYEVRLLTEGLSSLVEDLVSARSHLEEKVSERTAELERANRAKDEFLANMSHEIRTPMTAILGYAELCLASDVTPEDRVRYTEIIHANGEHLLSVINDILDISKIEAGRMTVEPTLCSPFDVVSEVRTLMELRAREKGIELSVENQGRIAEVVRTDPTRLRQILLNLVNNAVKFTEQGSVVLRFFHEPRTEGGDCLVFEVRDTGVGLTSEQLERVFRPFVQADNSTTRKYGGSGLGLAISRALARMLGGDLTGTSELGTGSVFRVSIDPGPLDDVRRLEHFPALRPRKEHRLELSDTSAGLRGTVLLAEDVSVNRRLISTLFLRTGVAVDEAENGRVALEKALAASEAGRPYDIVFMDMQMPEMDGYDATRRLREAGYTRPIVALTSHSMPNEKERCLEAGCDEYMTKPIDRLVLLQVLGRFLSDPLVEPRRAAS